MAEWMSNERLRHHFGRHARRLGCATIQEYDASARATIEVGTQFEYRDPELGVWRMGFYDRFTRRFTATDQDGVFIVTHFRCPERYVADTLPGSTYA
jgi:hypothetical protein